MRVQIRKLEHDPDHEDEAISVSNTWNPGDLTRLAAQEEGLQKFSRHGEFWKVGASWRKGSRVKVIRYE